jgi:hypothetical protein
MRDIVDYIIGLSTFFVVPARQPMYSLAGWFDNPSPESTISSQSGTKNSASDIANKYISRRRAPLDVVIIPFEHKS